MVALLVALLLALFGGLVPKQHAATVMKPAPPPFTVDGRVPPVRAGAVDLREAEVVRFRPAGRVLVVNRLECAGDVHRLALRHATWRVPDLPTGYYGLETGGRGQLVRVQSHSAPCP